jgi:mRNA-degrading endonuclease RelE of RelBE toxin-antitoxin system
MTTTYQKLEIQQFLNRLDAVQSEQVLDYIKGLLQNPQPDFHSQYVRRKAMKEIGQALREGYR